MHRPTNPQHAGRRRRRAVGRVASALTFVALFVAGGAFSAAAGDAVGEAIEASSEAGAAADCASGSGDEAGATSGSGGTCTETGADTTPDETPPAEDSTPPTDTGSAAESSETIPQPDLSGDVESSPDTSETGDGAPAGDADSAPSSPPASGSASGSGAGSAAGGSPSAAPHQPPLAEEAAAGSHGDAAGNDSPGAPLFDGSASAIAPTTLDPEGLAAGATVWLHRVLPDPTPPAKRLAPSFAKALKALSSRHGVRWTRVLAVVRARGHDGRVPATRQRVEAIAVRLADLRRSLGTNAARSVFLAFSGRPTFADRAVALERYNRAAGLRALVIGIEAAQDALARRVLADERIQIYPGGRDDIRAGRVDVRVLILLRYLRIAHGSVSVASLVSGHRLYARPGAISAHVYGLAVDVASLGGVAILGHQEPGGLAERAIRDILLLPAEVSPRQVISLLGLGGASFPLADHADHLHIGY